MIDPPTSYLPEVPGPPEPPPPPPRESYRTPGTMIAWLVILGALGAHFASRAASRPDPHARSNTPDLQLQIAARQAVGTRHAFPQASGAATTGPATPFDQQLGQLQRLAERPIDRLRVAIVVPELRGAEPALEMLRSLDLGDSPEIERDVEALETIYT